MAEKESSQQPLTNKEKLELAAREIKELEHVVEKETNFGVYDNHDEIPEGEYSWKTYLEQRPKDGIVRDEQRGGYREAQSRKFASEDRYLEQQNADSLESTEPSAPRYDEMGVMALAKEASRARERHDVADEQEIEDLARERIREAILKSEEKDNAKYKPEEVQRRLEEDLDRFKSLIESFEARLNGAEKKAETSEEVAPKQDEYETWTYNGEVVAVTEWFESPNGRRVAEVVNENGNVQLVYKDDLEDVPTMDDSKESAGADKPGSDSVAVDMSEPTVSEDKTEQTSEALGAIQKEHEARDKQEEEKIQLWLSDEKYNFNQDTAEAYRKYSAYRNKRELERGRIFPDRNAFIRYDQLTRSDLAAKSAEMGLETGFDQGQRVIVKRTSGEIESDWTFIGVDSEGRALVGKVGDKETGTDNLYKHIDVDALKELQLQAEQQKNDAEKENKARLNVKEWLGKNRDKFGVNYWAAQWNTMRVTKRDGKQAKLESMSNEEKEQARKNGRRNIIIGTSVLAVIGAFASYK
ncbi:hypothetical protein GW746_00505, partial [Candidatus Saccharibacteria bacterium]|nr:hypothetical protein [Candidatus Saccharibacteria bacterium]